jgi:hypothetical protein
MPAECNHGAAVATYGDERNNIHYVHNYLFFIILSAIIIYYQCADLWYFVTIVMDHVYMRITPHWFKLYLMYRLLS